MEAEPVRRLRPRGVAPSDGERPAASRRASCSGPADTDPILRGALATGADKAIRVDANDDQLDGDLVARVLKAIVAKEKPDVVVLGKQTVDGDTNQVGQLLAEYLDWPQATFAATIEEENGALLVGREVDGGVAKLRVNHPAVVTVDLRNVAPTSVYSLKTARRFKYNDGVRFAALPAIMAAKKKPLETLKLADLGDSSGPCDTSLKVSYGGFTAPPTRKAGIKVKDVAGCRSWRSKVVARTSPTLEERAREFRRRSPAVPRSSAYPAEGGHAMSSDVLVVSEIAEGKLKKTTHSAIHFAREAAKTLGGSFSILAIGKGAEAASKELATFGAAKVLVADDASLEHYLAERFAPTIAAAAQSFAGTASAFGGISCPASQRASAPATSVTSRRSSRQGPISPTEGQCSRATRSALRRSRRPSTSSAFDDLVGRRSRKVARAHFRSCRAGVEFVGLDEDRRPELGEAHRSRAGAR